MPYDIRRWVDLLRSAILVLAMLSLTAACEFESAEEKKARMEIMARARAEAAKQERLKKAKMNVSRDFFDPETTKFRDIEERVVTVKGPNEPKQKLTIICGEVNSKNRFGAYVGYRPFLVVAHSSLSAAKRQVDQWSPGDRLINSANSESDNKNVEQIVGEFLEKATFEDACGDGQSIPSLSFIGGVPGIGLADRSKGVQATTDKSRDAE